MTAPFRPPMNPADSVASLRGLFQGLQALGAQVPELRGDAGVAGVIEWANTVRAALIGLTSANRPRQARPVEAAPALGDVQFTADGGLAVRLWNASGAPTVRGTLVQASASVENGAEVEEANGYDPLGVWLEDGTPAGRLAWVVLYGRAFVLTEDGHAAVAGHWARVSDSEAGRAFTDTAPSGGFPAVTAEHFREIGHVLAGGTGSCFIALHFN